MTKVIQMVKKIDSKIGEVKQETFNAWGYAIIFAFIIIPMFCIGLNKWADMYLK
ncbi:hypothetical protein D3C71_1306630 [compost metagenome]